MWFFTLLVGCIVGALCTLLFLAGKAGQREGRDAINRQLRAEMHHFGNDRYIEFTCAAAALAARDMTLSMYLGNPTHLTEAQKERFVDQVILNDRRNKSRVGHPLQFGPF